MEMEISAKNFGPISSGQIKLKPLTVFIGPNNSGKSYVAMLIHSIMETFSRSGPFETFGRFGRPVPPRSIENKFSALKSLAEVSTLKRQLSDIKEGEEVKIPNEIIRKMCHYIFEELLERRLSEEIFRSFASPLHELVKIGGTSFSLGITYNSERAQLIYQQRKLKITEWPMWDIEVVVKLNPKVTGLLSVNTTAERVFRVELGMFAVKGSRERELIFEHLIDIILNLCSSIILRALAMPCYYLPAARSGILQGHKALAGSIVRLAPYAGTERLEIAKFSGVVADFISSIITLSQEKGPFYKLAQDLEKELIKGEIVVRTLEEFLYPEIKYRFEKTEIPLHRSSSTVSELAPLILYLKYAVQPGSLLIIEEPEAHLHPQNQLILGKFLVRLVRKDVRIIITTHSEFLLEQLNSFILLSKVEPEKRVAKYKYAKDDFLKPEEIVTYVFTYDKKSGGHIPNEIEITEEDGISEEEFLKVHEALVEETIKIRRDWGAPKQRNER